MSILNNPYNLLTLKRQDFLNTALEIFKFQAKENEVYKKYIQLLGKNVDKIDRLEDIPFLPIQFFKSHKVVSFLHQEELLFESSATSGQEVSKHYIKDAALYDASLLGSFEQAFGPAQDYCILALLPHYLERANSSLVYMVQKLMDRSKHPMNGFYLNNISELVEKLKALEEQGQKTILLGVTFALLDLVHEINMPLKHTLVMETGGMKGRKEELTREEVHAQLKTAFSMDTIYSEYGMAELLSQSYLKEDGTFKAPPWKKILIRDIYDPFDIKYQGRGAINIIDLANLYSCSFIATEDIGELFPSEEFAIHGRLDQSEIRGCNLLLND